MPKKTAPVDLSELATLLLRSPVPVRIINAITLYRIITFPLLLYFAAQENIGVFKWLLLASFATDAIDGFLARKFKATSILGSKLDSIGDDLTILGATIGLVIAEPAFVKENALIISVLVALFLVQVAFAVYRYRKISTFHTYLAKTAAVVTALFLLSVFFLGKVYYPLFYLSAGITAVELIEEIILVTVLAEYRSNVKGLYWVLRHRSMKQERGGAV